MHAKHKPGAGKTGFNKTLPTNKPSYLSHKHFIKEDNRSNFLNGIKLAKQQPNHLN